MSRIFKIKNIFVVSALLWLISMGLIYHSYRFTDSETELGYISSDIKIDSEEKEYYNIYKDGLKIGYKSEAWAYQANLLLLMEESVIKMNFAGLSREVFFQSLTAIDTTAKITKSMQFGIQSGTHMYEMSALVSGDSLNISVKKDRLAPWSKGTFIVDEDITFPNVLPYFMSAAPTEKTSFMVFDPILFSTYSVDTSKQGIDVLKIEDENVSLQKYEVDYLNKRSNMWLGNGRLKKADKYMPFGGIFDGLEVVKSTSTEVFRLPLDVTLGNDIINELTIIPDKPINNPRDLEYLEIELAGIRAANIDLNSANKEIISINPLILGIYNKPVISGDEKLRESQISDTDTSFVGTSDYIQSLDARIVRKAHEIITEGDSMDTTLSMARSINQWVYSNVEKLGGVDITRSVDILRNLKGDCDEYTKLFTALARSLGIKTEIHMGLLYDDGVFKYHSWPAVFADGVWHSFDPTLGQDVADASHITLVRGDFEKLIELLRIAENISIKVHDYR